MENLLAQAGWGPIINPRYTFAMQKDSWLVVATMIHDRLCWTLYTKVVYGEIVSFEATLHDSRVFPRDRVDTLDKVRHALTHQCAVILHRLT